jgi:hypothetical protein
VALQSKRMRWHGHLRVLRRRDRAWLPGIALAAVWVTHRIAYHVAAPDAHERVQLLDATGHGYLPVLAPVVISLLVASIGCFILQRSRDSALRSNVSYSAVAGRLALLQVVAFLGMELAERVANGASSAEFLQPVVGVGLVLQLVSACVVASLLFMLGRAVEAIRRSWCLRRRVTHTMSWARQVPTVRRAIPATGGPTLRAPPA